MKKYIASCLIIILSGCANSFKENYVQLNKSVKNYNIRTNPEVVKIDDTIDMINILKSGFVILGVSEFYKYYNNSYELDAKIFGADIKADKILLNKPVYKGSNQITLKTYRNKEYNVDGKISGNVLNINYNETQKYKITTQEPEYNTYTYSIYKFSAIYLEKIDYVFGAYFINHKSNVMIILVVDNSVAYNYGFEDGDIILSVNDYKINSVRDFNIVEQKLSKTKANIKFIRDYDNQYITMSNEMHTKLQKYFDI